MRASSSKDRLTTGPTYELKPSSAGFSGWAPGARADMAATTPHAAHNSAQTKNLSIVLVATACAERERERER